MNINEQIYNFKNLSIINFNYICYKSFINSIDFLNGVEITKSDLKKLFQYYFLSEFLILINARKNYSLLLYVNDELMNNSKYFDKIFFNFLTKKLKCNYVISNLDFCDFCKLLDSNTPQYDEYISKTFSMAEAWKYILERIKKYNFNTLDKQYNNFENKLRALIPSS